MSRVGCRVLMMGGNNRGTRPLMLFLQRVRQLFKYDVVVLLDPDPREFDEEGIELLKQFVREHSGRVALHARDRFLPEGF